MNDPTLSASTSKEWFGQPRGLTILFLTEMWDQFSFFGMRALLVLYMTKHLMLAQERASWIYGVYAAMAYLTPLFGGVIADRWLGRRSAVILGGLIMAAGHFMMAEETLFLFALGTIALGNGLFLPSLAGQIDSLYAQDDPRRRSAYSVYYVGINVGALAAPIVIGTIGELYGFHLGFAVAGVGMIVAMSTYILGGRYLPAEPVRRPHISPAERHRSFPIRMEEFKKHFSLLIGIALIVVIFRGAYEQLGNTVALWADQSVDRTVSGALTIPVTWFQSLNPMIVFLLTPLLVSRWTKMARRQMEPSSGKKMVIGAAVIGSAYMMVAAAAYFAHTHSLQVSWIWMALFIVIMTAGELYILPVGLGLFGRLAPQGLTATTIAIWYSAGFLGNLFAGWLGTFWTRMSHESFFFIISAVAFLAALLLEILAPRVGAMEKNA